MSIGGEPKIKVAVIGGGAAGFFSAINCKQNFPQHEVEIFEKTHQLLSKVKVSGGGRCNVTHQCFEISKLCGFYPRGEKKLKQVFQKFQPRDTLKWFQENGVEIVAEGDNRMFPTSNKSSTIISCFLDLTTTLNIPIHIKHEVTGIKRIDDQYELYINGKKLFFDSVIITAGGGSKLSSYDWLKKLDLKIVPPVPSLFTFNIPSEKTANLMGAVANNCTVRIQGEKLLTHGPVLFTHWGFSGPAILKLSAWGARLLADKKYQFIAVVNWTGNHNEDQIRSFLQEHFENNNKKILGNCNPFGDITARIWEYLIERSENTKASPVAELSKKNLNKLINTLLNDEYQVQGKTTFKEEFVTCGGVDLGEVNLKTMESKSNPQLYFAGEILDIDGVTGGFNFQAAWSTSYIAAQLRQTKP